MRVMNAQQEIVENNEEFFIRQMDLDTKKEMLAIKQEQERQKIRDEKKEIEKIYNQYLLQKHPQYPIAKEKLANEERKPAYDSSYYYNKKED